MAGCPQLVRGARTNSARRAYPTHPPQGNQLNPYINYPFLTLGPLRRYIAEAHKAGARVKLYYTVREISTSMTELWALRALRGEVRARRPPRPTPQLRRRRDRAMHRPKFGRCSCRRRGRRATCGCASTCAPTTPPHGTRRAPADAPQCLMWRMPGSPSALPFVAGALRRRGRCGDPDARVHVALGQLLGRGYTLSLIHI